MHPSDDFLAMPELDHDRFRDVLRPDWGRYSPKGIQLNSFAGRVRPRNVHGFLAMDLTCNAYGIERTQQDVRLDDIEHYYAALQVAGGSTVTQNDRVAKVAAGDIVLVDSARPVTFAADDRHRYGQWFCLQLPRRSLVSHLGFEPQLGSCGRRGTPAGRLLNQLVHDAVDGETSGSAPAAPTCGSRSTIFSARCLRRPMRRRSPSTPTGCSRGSAASSRPASPIRTWAPARSRPRRGYRCATCRSCSRPADRPAANIYPRSASRTPRACCSAAPR
jgi:AraC-binding-like domain